jgi:acetyl-CoA carboxylase carboxyl transferase alpha subunit/acetyl-CoA carboxylase carboxyl transferase beta subunit
MTRSTVPRPRGAPAPDGEVAWISCPGCGCLIYRKRLERNLYVCPECDHHLRLVARARLAQLIDAGSFTETAFPAGTPDPLAFTDRRGYPERLREAVNRSGESEAAVVGVGRLGGIEVSVAVMDFAFLGGSMGLEVGRRVSGAAALALERGLPLVMICASGGARMQEGVFSLFQMARVSEALGRLREAGLVSVSVLTDPTYGGVSASFATQASILVAEPGAHVGFAGPRVVQETIRSALPPDFQTSEFLLVHGLVDRVESRAELRPLLIRILRLHGAGMSGDPAARLSRTANGHTGNGHIGNGPAHNGPAHNGPVHNGHARNGHAHTGGRAVLDQLDPWDVVQKARIIERPTTLDYLRTAFDEFVELHGDRCFADDPAVVGGVAAIGGRSVVVIGHEKGHTVRERVARNFGMPHPEGYRKALRLLAHAETFGLPVVTLVDTPGAHPGPEAEERGQAHAIAEIILRSSRLRVPVVAVVTGEGGSGGALALCTSDRLLVLENAFLSVISPEGCAAILWRTAAEAPTAARAMRLGAGHLLASGIATGIVPEPGSGAHTDPAAAARMLRTALLPELDELAGLDVATLVDGRSRRFSAIGDQRLAPTPVPHTALRLELSNDAP